MKTIDKSIQYAKEKFKKFVGKYISYPNKKVVSEEIRKKPYEEESKKYEETNVNQSFMNSSYF